MNGAGSSSDTEDGAYTLVGGQTTGTAPARNNGATFYIPTEDQWYKAAYYKGGGTTAGYWDYATRSDTPPTAVTANETGIGSAGSTDNFANYNLAADWNSQNGNVTTVGTNGEASAYDAFDMSGNPTITLPAGFTVKNTPVAIQLVSAHLDEATLIRAGSAFQRVTDWHSRVPPRL
jgi:Asp-tRNA(Asn)/Glu-tRNA(Gln) amidotransferase A subunit family amidase